MKKRETIEEMIGNTYGEITVISHETESRESKEQYVNGVCSCGKEVIVRKYCLLDGGTKSCGCLRDKRIGDSSRTHGLSHKIPEYSVWKNIRRRCNNKKRDDYERYGGRGIRVCERWDDFELFLEDMGHRPSDKHSIDRIDNDKDYNPENCRWVTSTEQQRNKGNNYYIEYNGETMCMSAWAEKLGFSRDLLKNRIYRGWSIEKAFTTPKKEQPNKRYIDYIGEKYRLSELARKFSISSKTLTFRLKSGWSVDDAVNTPVDYANKINKEKEVVPNVADKPLQQETGNDVE